MICYVCKKELIADTQCAICINCEEASFLCNAMHMAFEEWSKTLHHENMLWVKTKMFVINKINIIDRNQSIFQQIDALIDLLESLIKCHLKFYNKDDLIVSLLVIKEGSRRTQLKQLNDGREWIMLNEYELSIQLMQIIFKMPIEDFLGAPIGETEDGYSSFTTVIALARVLIMLKANLDVIQVQRVTQIENLDLIDLAFKPVETHETENFFLDYLEMGLNERPEDFEIQDKRLKSKLDAERRTLKYIKKDLYELIAKNFGFTLNDLNLFSIILYEEFPSKKEFENFINSKTIFYGEIPHLAILKRQVLKEQFFSNLSQEAFDNIINTFSLNNICTNTELDPVRMFELRSIYEKDDLLIFGRVDFLQNISTLEQFILSGHFIEFFMPKLSENISIIKAQKKLSTYLSYVIADKLYLKGYKLPMEPLSRKLGGGLVPMAEIDKILIDGSNIIKQPRDIGDIDVLALDESKKQIILFEFKHYKPALNAKDFLLRDKNKIVRKEIIRKMNVRNDIFRNNINDIVSYFGWDTSIDYTVRSILVTARPNYYASNYINDVECYNWTNLMEKLDMESL